MVQPRKASNKQRVTALLYGAPGVGKTRLLSRLHGHPQFRDVLFFDFDDGSCVASDTECLTTGPLRTSKQVQEWYTALAKRSDGLENVGTVVVDSLTQAELVVRAEIDQTANVMDMSKFGLQEWGARTARMVKFIREMLYMLPDLNVFFTAHEDVVRQQDTQKVLGVEPALTAKLVLNASSIVDGVWYYTRDSKGKRLLYLDRVGVVNAKTRVPRWHEKGPVLEIADDSTLLNLLTT